MIQFFEDNWLQSQRIGQEPFDGIAGSIVNMLDFHQAPDPKLFFNPNTGKPQ
jgi:hypothetical protein